MALLWCDGFEHYGIGSSSGAKARMLEGVYAAIGSMSTAISESNPRTGTRALILSGVLTDLRRIFGAPKSTAGVGLALWLQSLPNNNTYGFYVQFSDSANANQCGYNVLSTGAIAVRRGAADTGTILATSADGVVVAGAYQHIEVKATIHDTTGSIEVRVNGVTVVSVSGVDTKNTAIDGTSQVTISSGLDGDGFLDDLYAWDGTGTENNDFIGDVRVYTILPSANESPQDWTSSSGSAYTTLAKTTPLDTTYISDAAAPGVSQFALANLPATVSAVVAVQTYVRQLKTDAGAANTQISLGEGASFATGVDRPLTTAATYYMDVFETDPSTGAPWVPADLDTASLQISRTA